MFMKKSLEYLDMEAQRDSEPKVNPALFCSKSNLFSRKHEKQYCWDAETIALLR